MRAMVLCAGYGTRLGDVTRELPKAMLSLQDRPVLEYIISHLAHHGFDEIAINLHFMPELIREYFGDGSRWNVQLTYSYEDHLLGTAGGVKRMERFLEQGDLFLVQYGDVLTDQDFTAMIKFHHSRRALATLLLHERAHSNSVVALDDSGRLVQFLERPPEDQRRGVRSSWVNSGVCICDPRLLDFIPARAPCDLPRDIFTKLVAGGELYGYPLSGYRCAIDSPERYAQAQFAVAERLCEIVLQ